MNEEEKLRLQRKYQEAEACRQSWFDAAGYMDKLAGDAYARRSDHEAETYRRMANILMDSHGPRTRHYWESICREIYDTLQGKPPMFPNHSDWINS